VKIRPRLIYDGVCNLCASAVRFLFALDRGRLLEYVPSQQLSPSIRKTYGLTQETLQGRMYMVLENGSVVGGPFAMVRICKQLSPFGLLCNIFKTQLAQRLYDWIADRRYRIFGCRDACYIIEP